MNAEQIEMLKRLKAPIDEYMGELQLQDNVFLEDGHCGFISRIKSEKDGGYIYVVWEDGKESCDHPDFKESFLRIPPLCTPDGKRCLWGMVDWKVWNFENMSSDGNVLIFQKMSRGGVGFRDADPYTAVLKALCEQFEV